MRQLQPGNSRDHDASLSMSQVARAPGSLMQAARVHVLAGYMRQPSNANRSI